MSNSKNTTGRFIAIYIISNCPAPASLLATFAALAMPSVLSRHGLNGVVSRHVARLAALAWLLLLSRHVTEVTIQLLSSRQALQTHSVVRSRRTRGAQCCWPLLMLLQLLMLLLLLLWCCCFLVDFHVGKVRAHGTALSE